MRCRDGLRCAGCRSADELAAALASALHRRRFFQSIERSTWRKRVTAACAARELAAAMLAEDCHHGLDPWSAAALRAVSSPRGGL